MLDRHFRYQTVGVKMLKCKLTNAATKPYLNFPNINISLFFITALYCCVSLLMVPLMLNEKVESIVSNKVSVIKCFEVIGEWFKCRTFPFLQAYKVIPKLWLKAYHPVLLQ